MIRKIPLHPRKPAVLLIGSVFALGLVAPPVSARTIDHSFSSPTTYPRWLTLAGSLPPRLAGAQRLHRAPADQQIDLTITLRIRDQSALDRYLATVYNSGSPTYRHFLTAREFAQRFAPSAASQAATAHWLKSSGLKVLGISSNGLQITARGTISTVQSTFASPVYTFRQGSHTFVANTQSVRIPGYLSPTVLSVSGLTTATVQSPVRFFGPRQSFGGRGYTPAALNSVYGVDPLRSQGISGAGQTIAIASFADFSTSNVATFDQQFGISGTVSRIRISDGRTTGAPLGVKNGQDEAEADVEIVQGIAPHATILMYEAPNSSRGAVALYNRIVSDNRAAVITTSWGGAEPTFPASDLSAIHQAIQQAAAQGQALFAASGDSGAFDAAGNGGNSDTTLAVDFPASDPWVTGVGGTTLQSSSGQYLNEVAWSDDSSLRTPVGGGGGLSEVFARPSYQTGPGVANGYSNGKRQVPDVAANADPRSGYAVYTVNPSGSASWGAGGGTSASSPLWASFATLVNQALGRRIGFLNPLLYELGRRASTFAQSPFHDVTQGTNLYYSATNGWDFATGWGSFDAAAFVADLKTIPLPAPVATPVPTATALPTATPRPAQPTVTITQVLLLHVVNGKVQRTSSLRVGETGTLVILYSSTHTGSQHTVGNAQVRQNGQVIKTSPLKSTVYQGHPALAATVHFTSSKRVGTLLARVTLKLGAVSTALSHPFKLLPKK